MTDVLAENPPKKAPSPRERARRRRELRQKLRRSPRLRAKLARRAALVRQAERERVATLEQQRVATARRLAMALEQHADALLRTTGAVEPAVTAAANDATPHTTPILVGIDEAARLLSTTPAALRKRVERHQAPGVLRLSGRVQFDLEKLKAGISRRARP